MHRAELLEDSELKYSTQSGKEKLETDTEFQLSFYSGIPWPGLNSTQNLEIEFGQEQTSAKRISAILAQ